MYLLSQLDLRPFDLIRCSLPEQPLFRVLRVGYSGAEADWWVIQSATDYPTAYCFDLHKLEPIWLLEKRPTNEDTV